MNRPIAGVSLALCGLFFVAGCAGDPRPASDAAPVASAAPIPPAATNILTRAELALGEGDAAAALRAADESLRRAPQFARAYVVRARALGRLDSLQAAHASLLQARALDPNLAGLDFFLGENAARRRDIDAAFTHFRAAMSTLEPADASMYASAVRMQVGNTLRELGRPEEALEAYRDALAADTTLAPALDAIGQLYQEAGAYEQALEVRRDALALQPESGEYAYQLGALLVLMDRPAEALPYLEAAREALPWYHGAAYNLGRSLVALGRTREGERLLLQADSLQQRQARLGLARAAAEAGRTAAAWTDYARLLEAESRWSEAADAYRRARLLDPSDPTPEQALLRLAEQLAPAS